MDITVCKADPRDEQEVPDVTIHITGKLPAVGADTLEDLGKMYDAQADLLVAALWCSLPQAIRWRLLSLLMGKHAEYYRGV